MIDKKIFQNLPSLGGVYIFKKNKSYLYVGKSVNIKARIKAHIENAKLDSKERALIKNSDSIEYIITDSEFKAILLEAELIKKYRPKYNSIWKDDKSFIYIKINNKDEYPRVFLSRKKNDKSEALYFGPFPSVKIARQILKELRKIVPFCTEKKLNKGACFYSKIGLCQPCPGAIIKEKDDNKKKLLRKIYRENIRRLINLLQGKTQSVMNDFSRQLNKKIKEENFEEAIIIRDKILHLQYLEKHSFYENNPLSNNESKIALKSLIELLSPYYKKLKKLERIECYDVSNLRGENACASLVVLTNGLIDKSQYRRFKINNPSAKNDLKMLEDVFLRRFKKAIKSPKPDLILVDGGKPQVKLLKNVLKKLKIDTALVGIAKNPDRLVVSEDKLQTITPSANHPGFKLIKILRDESHRFAHKYHLFLRKKGMKL